jgi:AcrR family transcriptional regulator
MNEPDLRARILRVATALFADKGYGSTSVREVVDAAGVTKPTLYYWFGSKDALFIEAVNNQLDRLRGLIDTHLRAPGPVEPLLRGFVGAWIDHAERDRDGLMLLMTCEHATAGQPQIDLVTMHRDTVIALSELIARGAAAGELRANLPPELAATSLLGAVQLYLMAAAHGMPPSHQPADAIVDLFLHGARP